MKSPPRSCASLCSQWRGGWPTRACLRPPGLRSLRRCACRRARWPTRLRATAWRCGCLLLWPCSASRVHGTPGGLRRTSSRPTPAPGCYWSRGCSPSTRVWPPDGSPPRARGPRRSHTGCHCCGCSSEQHVEQPLRGTVPQFQTAAQPVHDEVSGVRGEFVCGIRRSVHGICGVACHQVDCGLGASAERVLAGFTELLHGPRNRAVARICRGDLAVVAGGDGGKVAQRRGSFGVVLGVSRCEREGVGRVELERTE